MKVKIDNKYFVYFNNITINYALDAVASTFSLGIKFDPSNRLHKELFKPFAFKQIEIFNNKNALLLTGYLVMTDLKSSKARTFQKISGYSKPGILENCSIPYSSYPLEKLNVSLEEVTRSILSDFDFGYEIETSVKTETGLRYDKTVAQPSESIKGFLSKLAAQRNIVLSHTPEGNLLFSKPDPLAKPKRFYSLENTISMGMIANGQGMHSEISVIRQPSKSNTSLIPVDTAKNSMLSINKPLVKVLSSGAESATKKAADSVLAGQLKNLMFSISLDYIDSDLKCGDIVEVENPEIYLFNRTKLMISSISVKENQNSENMTFNLVLPETYSGEAPKNIFE